MAISEEEAEQIKSQLLKQLGSWPPEQRDAAKKQIETMNPEELEQFLIQNNLIKQEGKSGEKPKEEECVFCSILQNKIPSYKLDENKSSMAILEINPLSKGHSIVISKNHNKLPSSAFSLANKLSKRIKSKLKAGDIKIESGKVLGHNLINIIPFYKDAKLEKKKASEQELILLQDKLKAKQKKKKEKKVHVEEVKLPFKPIRIP